MCQIDRSKSFEEALHKFRKASGITKDILKNRKRSLLTKTLTETTSVLINLKRKVRRISDDDVEFLEEVNWVSRQLSEIMAIPIDGDSAMEHRKLAVTSIEASIKTLMNNYQKNVSRAKRKMKLSIRPARSQVPKHQPPEIEFDKNEISPEEAERYLAEATMLKEDFDEVALIESKVTNIAQLSHKIAENIYLQAEVADEVQNNVQQTNENVRDGNDQILQATRRQSDWRVFTMIFVLGCSLTLLLLDSYK